MPPRQREHRVLNVYGSDRIEVIDQAVELAKEDGADSDAAAIAEVCAAYCGCDPP